MYIGNIMEEYIPFILISQNIKYTEIIKKLKDL